METITLTKKEYSELLKIRRKLDKLLEIRKKRISPKKEKWKEAFGILRGAIKGSSLNYLSKLRKEWRK